MTNYEHEVKSVKPEYKQRTDRSGDGPATECMRLDKITVRMHRKEPRAPTRWKHTLRFDVDPDAGVVVLGQVENTRNDSGRINATALRETIVRAERTVAEWLLVHGLEQYQVNRYHATLEAAADTVDETADTPAFDERNA
jgi:hypothetical protein